jgi:hypothetical protein
MHCNNRTYDPKLLVLITSVVAQDSAVPISTVFHPVMSMSSKIGTALCAIFAASLCENWYKFNGIECPP